MVGLHAFTHDLTSQHDGENNLASNCLVCDLALTQQLTPVLQAGEDDFNLKENPAFYVERNVVNTYQVTYKSSWLQDFHFGRPPPFLG